MVGVVEKTREGSIIFKKSRFVVGVVEKIREGSSILKKSRFVVGVFAFA